MHHSEKNSSRLLGPHSIHTWAGDRHWQDENAWLIAERTHAREGAVSCQMGVGGGLDGETLARLECDAAGRRPRTNERGEVWRSADAVRERSGRDWKSAIDKGQCILARRVDQLQHFLL